MVVEPITLIEPERVDVVGFVADGLVAVVELPLLHPTRVKTVTSTNARGKNHFTFDLINFFSFYLFCVIS